MYGIGIHNIRKLGTMYVTGKKEKIIINKKQKYKFSPIYLFLY